MKDVPAMSVKDEDAMLGVISEKKILKRDTMFSAESRQFLSSSITRTNTDLMEHTEDTVHRESPLNFKAMEMDIDEPEEPPMRDLSPEREHSLTRTKLESAGNLTSNIGPESSPPRKGSDDYGSDPQVHIVGEDDQ